MALKAEIHGRIERQIFIEIGAMHFMAAQTGQRRSGSFVDNAGADWMRSTVGIDMAARAEIEIKAGEVLIVVGTMRCMTSGAADAIVREVRFFRFILEFIA